MSAANVKRAPATKSLPFRVVKRATQVGVSSVAIVGRKPLSEVVARGWPPERTGLQRVYTPVNPEVVQDFEYLCHAANAYPRLVEFVREARNLAYCADQDTRRARLDALLRDLGEEG